ncbi:MAG: GNAT family N-acetyltransferase [Desulfobacterales bacterium]|nr:GNAT family N-acetyltransferase [Desulfobacterales bacterium]
MLFKRMREDDFEYLLHYLSNPAHTIFLPLEKPYPENEVRTYLDNRVKHWEKFGFGVYMLSLKSTGETVGYCGLERFKETEFIDIRYGLANEFWGRGLALEAAKAVIHEAFVERGTPVLYGAAVPDNASSVSILKKLGMTPCDDVDFYGDVVDYFSIQRTDYLNTMGG